jgi:hypothetical protein
MNRNRKYIALSLSLVFTLPVIYQSWHNVLHHLNETTSNIHHSCSVDKESDSCRQKPEKKISPEVNDNRCVIKEYEFSIKDLPAQNPVFTKIYLSETEKKTFLNPGHKNFSKSSKASRAPPAIS